MTTAPGSAWRCWSWRIAQVDIRLSIIRSDPALETLTDDTARTAHHEAAHAVVAAVRDIPIRYVTIHPRRADHQGMTVVRHRKVEPPWENYGALLAAGPIADDIYTGAQCRPQLARPAGDLALLRDMSRDVRKETRSGSPPPGIVVARMDTVRAIAEAAWQEAYADLMNNYGAVLAVANRLLSSRRTLDGVEVRRMVAATPPVFPPPCGELMADFWPSWFMRGWWTPADRRSGTS
jgi:hypothetical protein